MSTTKHSDGGSGRRGAQTRLRVEQAAAALFTSQGYTGTSIQAVADAAGVHAQTIYQAYGTKAALLGAVGARLVAGDDDPATHPSQRPWVRRIEAEDDPARKLRLYVRHIADITPRVGVLIDVLRATAPAEPEASHFLDQIEDGRYLGPLNLLAPLAERDQLRDGLTLTLASDLTYALASPDTYRALTGRRGWSDRRAQQWLTQCLVAALLPPRC